MKRLYALTVILSMEGCSLADMAIRKVMEPPPKCDTLPIELTIEADSALNRNREGRSAPVKVHYFFLTRRERFDALEPETIANGAVEALAEDFISSGVMTVYPGKSSTELVKISAKARYLAVAGMYRDIDVDGWRRADSLEPIIEACRPDGYYLPAIYKATENRLAITHLGPEKES